MVYSENATITAVKSESSQHGGRDHGQNHSGSALQGLSAQDWAEGVNSDSTAS